MKLGNGESCGGGWEPLVLHAPAQLCPCWAHAHAEPGRWGSGCTLAPCQTVVPGAAGCLYSGGCWHRIRVLLVCALQKASTILLSSGLLNPWAAPAIWGCFLLAWVSWNLHVPSMQCMCFVPELLHRMYPAAVISRGNPPLLGRYSTCIWIF